MRIGIVTIFDNTNYGNRLQNYATYYILKNKLKYKVTTLVAREEKSFYNGNYVLWVKDQLVKKFCLFPQFVEECFGNKVTRWANFQKWGRLIPTKTYYSHKSLPDSLNKEYDLFFAGSDQIWNYHFSSNRFDDYFLKFAQKEKRVAISGSFGVEEIPEEWKQQYIDGLKGFSNISVREDAGKKIVKDLIGKDVPVLIDPTMMLTKEEWTKVSRKPRVDCSKPYVLKYYLGDENEENKIDTWAEENGYQVYELLNPDIPELYSAGPGEFISLIKNASLVCSDSFHCIVFSIIFSRPFVVYAREGEADYMTSRLETLLGKFGFQNRWKHLLNVDEYLDCDFSSTDEVFEKERCKFMEYISNALKK